MGLDPNRLVREILVVTPDVRLSCSDRCGREPLAPFRRPLRRSNVLKSLLRSSERRARLARDGGWPGIVRREIHSKRLKLYGKTRMVFLVDDLENPPPRLPAPEGTRIAPYAGEDWEAFRRIAGPEQRRKYAKRIREGRLLLVAWRGDDPVAVTWITERATMRLDGLALDLPAGWAYAYGLLVRPDARRGGLGTALTNARVHHARDLGFRRLCRVIRVRNVGALKSAAKARGSTTPAGELFLYQALGMKWLRWIRRP